MTSEVKRIPDEDFDDAYYRIFTNAYISDWSDDEQDKRQYLEGVKENQHTPGMVYYGCYRNGKLAGVFKSIDFRMRVRSHTVDVAGLSAVAVDMFHRRQGVAREMMRHFCLMNRKEGRALSVLHGFRTDFYQNLGWGLGSTLHKYRIEPGSLPRREPSPHIQFLSAGDREAFVSCYNLHYDRTSGLFEKMDNQVDRALSGSEFYKTIGYKKDGIIEGYISFFFTRDDQKVNDMVIREFIYNTPEALHGLVTFLHDLKDQIRTIILQTQDPELYHFLLRGNSDSLKQDIYTHLDGFPPYHIIGESGVIVMYRVLDLRGICAILTGRKIDGPARRIKCVVHDDFLDERNSVTLQTSSDGLQITDTESYDVLVETDMPSFSSLITGAVSFDSLCQYGLATLSSADHTDVVREVFRTDGPLLWPQPF